MADSLPLVRGTLDVLVLRALSWGPMHGFEITCWLEERSGGRLDVDDRALYQGLQRLEERGFIEADWGVTENNRRAKYYILTPAGRATLKRETRDWETQTMAIARILEASLGDL